MNGSEFSSFVVTSPTYTTGVFAGLDGAGNFAFNNRENKGITFASNNIQRMNIDNTGNITFSNGVPITTPTTVGALPTCNAGLKGARSFVTDELAAVAFNTIATGGGANNVPVFCDGTNWRMG